VIVVLRSVVKTDINPRHLGLTDRFRIYRETLSRFSCAASADRKVFPLLTATLYNLLAGSASQIPVKIRLILTP
ncbi:hypothetical protein ACB313_01050, partial [Klebsiella pneumoniae]